MGQAKQNLIGERVKTARARANPPITQEQLSRKLAKLRAPVDRAGVAKIEAGIRGVLDYELVAIAKALNVSITWLVGAEE